MSTQLESAASVWTGGSGLNVHYPNVRSVPVPTDSGAVRAYRCTIVPFRDDHEVDNLLWHLQSDLITDIFRGSLVHPESCATAHAPHALRAAAEVGRAYEVLVLEFANERHPLAYCIKPEISRTLYPGHPHLTDVRPLSANLELPALCTYRPSDNVFVGYQDRLVSFFDFLSFFLAKHQIWCNTRVLIDRQTRQIVERPPFRSDILDLTAPVRPAHRFWWLGMRFVWEGVWLGKSAAHDPKSQLAEISPWDECPCGNGQRYGRCHRPIDQANRKTQALLQRGTRPYRVVTG